MVLFEDRDKMRFATFYHASGRLRVHGGSPTTILNPWLCFCIIYLSHLIIHLNHFMFLPGLVELRVAVDQIRQHAEDESVTCTEDQSFSRQEG